MHTLIAPETRPFDESSRHVIDTSNPQSGEIFAIKQSILTPLEIALGRTKQAPAADYKSLTSIGSAQSLSRRGKRRPCVFINNDEYEEERDAQVCLMATLDGKPLSSFPLVWKHFCIPVYPTLGTEGSSIIHTTPEWDGTPGTPQWLVAIMYTPEKVPSEAWEGKKFRSNHRLTDAELENLEDICAVRWDTWQKWCVAQPNFRAEEYRKYRDHRKENSAKRRINMPSMNAMASMVLDPAFDMQTYLVGNNQRRACFTMENTSIMAQTESEEPPEFLDLMSPAISAGARPLHAVSRGCQSSRHRVGQIHKQKRAPYDSVHSASNGNMNKQRGPTAHEMRASISRAHA